MLTLLLLLASVPSDEEARWNAPVAPFRIADNLYYVGTADLASYLIVDPAGMILLDGGLPQSAPLILDSIRQLGFDPKRVRYLINSQAHYDHAGGLAALKAATGATLLASPPDAELLARGGAGDFAFGDLLIGHFITSAAFSGVGAPGASGDFSPAFSSPGST